jgi:hypothetical protein
MVWYVKKLDILLVRKKNHRSDLTSIENQGLGDGTYIPRQP